MIEHMQRQRGRLFARDRLALAVLARARDADGARRAVAVADRVGRGGAGHDRRLAAAHVEAEKPVTITEVKVTIIDPPTFDDMGNIVDRAGDKPSGSTVQH